MTGSKCKDLTLGNGDKGREPGTGLLTFPMCFTLVEG